MSELSFLQLAMCGFQVSNCATLEGFVVFNTTGDVPFTSGGLFESLEAPTGQFNANQCSIKTNVRW